MKMKKITIILVSVALIFQGCEEYLDKVQDSTGMDEQQVFTDYNNFRKFEDRMYKDMFNYLADYDYGMIASMCDEGYTESAQWEQWEWFRQVTGFVLTAPHRLFSSQLSGMLGRVSGLQTSVFRSCRCWRGMPLSSR